MVTAARDDQAWRIGTDAEVAWITDGTTVDKTITSAIPPVFEAYATLVMVDKTITSAIPPVFEAYATLVLPYRDEEQNELDRVVLALLSEQSPDQPWWLAYLDTGADDIVFP